MIAGCSHWGYWGENTESEACGSYNVASLPLPKPGQPGVVLTAAGDILVHRDCTFRAAGCSVAIVLERGIPSLTKPQVSIILRAWDIARTAAGNEDEAVALLPMPHDWHFSQSDYFTLEEWLGQTSPAEAGHIQSSLHGHNKSA
jgi:hypothetical protein